MVSTTTGFFLDGRGGGGAAALPPSTPARSPLLGETLASAAKFFAVMLALNIVMLLFSSGAAGIPRVLWGKRYLLGREYFEVVAARRLDPAAARILRRLCHIRTILCGWVPLALLLTIPLVNLLAPLVGTAAMVHLFATMQRRQQR
ncbi:MAG: hypothetical protein U1E38_09710 [Rhodospirillales bacterium]